MVDVAEMRQLLRSKLSVPECDEFSDDDCRLLIDNKFVSATRLEAATFEALRFLDVPLRRFLLNAFASGTNFSFEDML
jgi:hypothetical protein